MIQTKLLRFITTGKAIVQAPCGLVLGGILLAVFAGLAGPGSPAGAEPGDALKAQEPFVRREFDPRNGDRWIGTAIAYGPHRDGQRPGGPDPTRDQLRQDLQILGGHWGLLRMYSAVGPAETVCEIIQEEGLDMKVLLGVWIAVEETRDETGAVTERFPEAAAANRREVETAVRLASAYPDIVLGVNVGSETQVFWSGHRSPVDILTGYVREVRTRTDVPVTVADDFNFWNKPESRALARELDFLMVHAHPLWNGLQLEDALDWTQRTLDEIRAMHPDHPLVLGETGWATTRHTEGEQAELMKGRVGEAEQKEFYEAVTAWSHRERVPVFFFEAFDENWKGGDHPDEVEKHWGLYRADRTPKAAMEERDP